MGDLFISVSRERTNERTDPAQSVEATDGNTRFICKFHICRRERRRPSRRAASSLLERSHDGKCKSSMQEIHVKEMQLVQISIYFKAHQYSIIYIMKAKITFSKNHFIYILFNFYM